ncbi:trafficking kinesin-binding protein 1-like [Rhopilema esculentum]|uniref:trafficking kinesin-binding protein 1-like n=1 Tax=Rhopilema esculentum TaxID=499914 RepID=UPI0031D6A079
MSFYFEEPPVGGTSVECSGELGGRNGIKELCDEVDDIESELCMNQLVPGTDMNNDTADVESGVEPDSNEWIFQDIGESVEFDITAEQALATLRYFTSTAERANLLTKTHHDDLDVISELLQEKEKDLELAARIGQSLLHRNKNLLLKIEAMEDYISNVTDQKEQMKHEVNLKNDLIRNILREEEDSNLEFDPLHPETFSGSSFNDSGCKDESILLLEDKCKQLEKQNVELLTEALNLKDMAIQAEEEEQDLVVDCVKHLAFAKEQITHLTDEIALKFEDNVAQQEEITELISMVVELQRKQKQLSVENEDLQFQLEDSQQSQEFLRSQLIDMQRRFQECSELLRENQDEVKHEFRDLLSSWSFAACRDKAAMLIKHAEEITELISMVVELQRKQKQLSVENEDLQFQLEDSQQSQEFLRSQLIDMQRRFQECSELLRENQDEVKQLRDRVELKERDSWVLDHSPSSTTQHDSLACEIEETLKRELSWHDRNREKTTRVLEQVRNANKYLKPGSNYTASNSGNCSSAASLKSQTSVDSDSHSVSSLSRSVVGSQDFDDGRRRKGFLAAEKLQIVKPLEGSLTLHKWQHLASENVVAGLNVGNVLTHNEAERQADLQISPIDLQSAECSSTLSQSEIGSSSYLRDFDNGGKKYDDDVDDDDDNDDFGLTLKADRSNAARETQPVSQGGKEKQSTPIQASAKSMESMFTSGHPEGSKQDSVGLKALGMAAKTHHDRTIITRNSSVLASMREARSMLNKENGSAKAKANAIDILANAMSKANVEAKTGQRILESVSNRNNQGRVNLSTPRKDYQDMPKLNKVLERLAANKGKGKVDLDAVRTPLKLLVERAASISTNKNDATVKTGVDKEVKNKSEASAAVSRADVTPSLVVGPAGMRATTGVLNTILQRSGVSSTQTPLLSSVLSSNISAANSQEPSVKPALTRSWSSGDVRSLNKNDLSSLGSFQPATSSEGSGRVRRNSLNADLPSLSDTKKTAFAGLGMLKRSNSSGSLSDLVKQTEIKATTGSPPSFAPFISFDNYGVEDFSMNLKSSTSSGGTTTVTTTTSSTSATTTTVSKPTGFLRSFFLGSSSGSNSVDAKRPSSLHEGGTGTVGAATVGAAVAKGTGRSVESGINRFGKALAQEDFGGFGFGLMSYFSGSKNSKSGSSSP